MSQNLEARPSDVHLRHPMATISSSSRSTARSVMGGLSRTPAPTRQPIARSQARYAVATAASHLTPPARPRSPARMSRIDGPSGAHTRSRMGLRSGVLSEAGDAATERRTREIVGRADMHVGAALFQELLDDLVEARSAQRERGDPRDAAERNEGAAPSVTAPSHARTAQVPRATQAVEPVLTRMGRPRVSTHDLRGRAPPRSTGASIRDRCPRSGP